MYRCRTWLRRAGRWARRRMALADDGGSAAVELAIVMPAILLGLFACIQVAAVFMARSVALTGAQEGTTAERAYQAPAGTGKAHAESFLGRVAGDWLTKRTVVVTRNGNQVQVTVTGQALSLIPGTAIHVEQ